MSQVALSLWVCERCDGPRMVHDEKHFCLCVVPLRPRREADYYDVIFDQVACGDVPELMSYDHVAHLARFVPDSLDKT